MTALLILAVLSGLRFEEQDLDCIRVGAANELTGEPIRNYRHADLDADGEQDLVFTSFAVFQRNHCLHETDRRAFPHTGEPRMVDTYGDSAFFLYNRELLQVNWGGDGWRLERFSLSAPLPSGGEGFTSSRFSRFLHDLDADGVPELVRPVEEGLQVYVREPSGENPRYVLRRTLEVFPKLHVAPTGTHRLWPPEDRELASPTSEMACRLILDGPRVTIITSERMPGREVRYVIEHHMLDPGNGYGLVEGASEKQVTVSMPETLQPCRMNDDWPVDFAGIKAREDEGGGSAVPIHEICATTDLGCTIRRVRARSFRPRCCFVDYEGDGDLDMIVEESELTSGGTRESLARFISQKLIHHQVHIYLQDASGRFPDKPTLSSRFAIRLDAPPMRGGALFERYKAARILDITGDFDGDGTKDALVQSASNRLTVFRGELGSICETPVATLNVDTSWDFSAVDVNGDGLSDIALRRPALSTKNLEQGRVFLAREEPSS